MKTDADRTTVFGFDAGHFPARTLSVLTSRDPLPLLGSDLKLSGFPNSFRFKVDHLVDARQAVVAGWRRPSRNFARFLRQQKQAARRGRPT